MKIGDVFRYARPKQAQPALIDGFPNYFNATYTPDCRLALLESGINPIAGPIGSGSERRRPAILISSSPHKIGSSETPWQDSFDSDHGHIRYYGDNKTPARDPSEAPGNKVLLAEFAGHTSGDPSARFIATPLVFFRRVPHAGRRKGFVRFEGFGLISKAELVTQYSAKIDGYFTNYVFDFTVFDLAAEAEEFSWDWISARRNLEMPLAETHRSAPESWRNWLANGPSALQKCRRRVVRLQTTPRADQLPEPRSKVLRTLDEVYKYYDDRKPRFESLASAVTASVVDRSGVSYREGWLTPSSADGGADFIGRIDVGRGLASVRLVVLGQAKCEKPTAPTGGNHIARTVARLKRGWIGAYVTTSYFSESVQREVLEDKYPLLLINGRKLAEELLLMAQEDGMQSVGHLLEVLDARYEEMLANRRPEEILLI